VLNKKFGDMPKP